jgi:hypothetical protein
VTPRRWRGALRAGAALLAVGAFATLVALTAGVGGATARRQPGAPGGGGPDGGTGGAVDASATVRIVFMTVPPEKATVSWGRKPLGVIRGKGKPLTIERPRDSGPIDVVIRAKGFLPVRTRAHTFNDHKMFVKITPVEEKNTILGYREELPDAGPEGGTLLVGPPAPGTIAPPVPAAADAGAPPPAP